MLLRRLVVLHRVARGRPHHVAGPDVELAAVARAYDRRVLELSFGERALAMGTGVVEGEVRPADVRHGDRDAVRVERTDLPVGDLVGLREREVLGHALTPRVSGVEEA